MENGKYRIKCFCFLLPVLLILTACAGSKDEGQEAQDDEKEAQEVHVIENNEDAGEDEESQEELSENGERETESAKDAEQDAGTVVKKGILVALDPGHQGPDVDMSAMEPNAPGSGEMKRKATSGTSGSYSGIPEYQLCLDIALMLRTELEGRGYDVLMTREDNETAISNAERASLANDSGADISVRIHANGSEDPSSDGALALIASPENPYVGYLYEDSARLAGQILDSYCAATGLSNRGIQQNDTMTGINWSTIPVMILEMGFMTNEGDDLKMADSAFRLEMVRGIADGIDLYYGNAGEQP